jgi:hypothetical protein
MGRRTTPWQASGLPSPLAANANCFGEAASAAKPGFGPRWMARRTTPWQAGGLPSPLAANANCLGEAASAAKPGDGFPSAPRRTSAWRATARVLSRKAHTGSQGVQDPGVIEYNTASLALKKETGRFRRFDRQGRVAMCDLQETVAL